MIDKVLEKDCILCKACATQCPKKCISFSKAYKSFEYPIINYDECINCNLCEKVCPSLQEFNQVSPITYYAVKNKNVEILKMSSSGGIFYSLAKKIIEMEGIVVAARFDDSYNVVHEACTTIDKIKNFCGSKYVQSDLNGCYDLINKYLQIGKDVLFVGSSCQTAAVHQYFKNNCYRNNLFLVDFICHGIVSDNVFNEYKAYLEKKFNGKIVRFEFRNKKNGWLFSGLNVEFDNGKVYSSPLSKDLYMQGYFKNLNLKEACYTCKYKNFKSQSDITMGDYWDVEKTDPDFYEYYGNSVVVLNTIKGKKEFDTINCEFDVKEIDLETILSCNKSLIKPFNMSSEREDYFDKAKKQGYIRPLEKWVKKSFSRRMINKIKSVLK